VCRRRIATTLVVDGCDHRQDTLVRLEHLSTSLRRVQTFLGGFNVPSPGPFKGRRDVPRSLGALSVETGYLTLRPRVEAWSLFVPQMCLSVDNVLVACPTVPDFLRRNEGVAIVREDACLLYFWTLSPRPVLESLAAHGFRVSSRPLEVRAA
jgi:hypothetical protein